jgi:uncharacterized protein
MATKPKRFAVDVMLGRLARWLRILGYDTLYFHSIDDIELYRIALRDERFLLTRDRKLAEIAGNCAYLIESDLLKEQIPDVIEHFKLRRNPKLLICPVCNGKVVSVEKSGIEALVPEYTFRTHRLFFRCENCGKVYWHGTHCKLANRFLG